MATYEKINNLSIWSFPPGICQYFYGQYEESGSKSCTLTSLIFANRVSQTLSFSENVEQLPPSVTLFIAYTMDDGNRVYEDLNPDTLGINIPDAISILQRDEYINFQLNEWFFTQVCDDALESRSISVTLSVIISTSLKAYMEPKPWKVPPLLFATLIADGRTVMMCFDLRTYIAALFDPYQHGGTAVFAQAKFVDLENMLFWYISLLDDIYETRPQMFEITFLSTLPELAVRIEAPFEPIVTFFSVALDNISDESDDSEDLDISDPEST